MEEDTAVIIFMCLFAAVALIWYNKKSPVEQLFYEVRYNDVEAIKRLKKKGVSMNARDPEGDTVLIWALGKANSVGWRLERREAIVFLLQNGADVDERGRAGCTPLMYVARYGELELAQLLVEYGAKVNLQDNNGNTALSRAIEYGNLDIAHYLREHGAKE